MSTRPRTLPGLALSVVVGGAVASAANALVALLSHAAGVSADFRALQPPSYIALTVIGIVAGAIGWSIIRNRATDPTSLLRWLVPTVVALSLIPDILLGATQAQPGTTWGAIVALMAMHVIVTVAAVLSYRRFLPLPEV